MTASLKLSGISLAFNGVVVLDDVSLDVQGGEIHALIGPNGAGKSSCFNVATGLYRTQRGTVEVDGVDVTTWSPHRRQRSGISRTFQNLMLVPELTVRENIMLGGASDTRRGLLSSALGLPRARRSATIDADRVAEAASLVGLEHQLDERTSDLSYGKRKHVEIARALSGQPRLLLLDEPAAGLSDSETTELAVLLDSLVGARDLTILIVEHHVGLVMSIADTITVLSAGKVVASGSPEEIQSNPEVLTAYLGTPDHVDATLIPETRS